MGRANNAEIIDEEDDNSILTITNVVGNMQMASNAQSREDVTELRREIGFLRAEISACNQGAANNSQAAPLPQWAPMPTPPPLAPPQPPQAAYNAIPPPSHKPHLMQFPCPTTHASPPTISDSRDEEGEEGERGGGEHEGASGAALE